MESLAAIKTIFSIGLDWLGKVDTISSFITTIFSIATFISVRSLYRRQVKSIEPINNLDELFEKQEGITTDKPVALAFSLTPQSATIKRQVESYLKKRNMKMPINEVYMSGINGKEGLKELHSKVRDIRAKFDIDGYEEVHLFINGPVQAGTIIGCLLNNWLPIKLYQRGKNTNEYEYWGNLIKP